MNEPGLEIAPDEARYARAMRWLAIAAATALVLQGAGQALMWLLEIPVGKLR